MRFDAVFENALDAMLLADDDRRYVDANPAACELTGYTRDELVGMRVDDLTPAPDRGAVVERWEAFLAAGRAEGMFDLLRRDGTVVVTDFRAVACVAPGVHLSVMHDITERVRAEQQAAERAERLELIFAQLPAVLWTTDRDFRYTFATGYRRSGVPAALADPISTGATFADQTETDEDLEVVLAAHRRALAGETASFDARAFGLDFHCHVEPLRDRDDHIVGVIGVGLDVSETVRMRRELEETIDTLHVLETHRRDLIRELLLAREDERRRLSREMHDGLGQTLTSAKLLAAGLEQAPDERLRNGLHEMQRLMQAAVDSTRALVGRLRGEQAEDPTLRASLQRLASETRATHGLGVEVSVNIESDLLPLPVVTAAYRIASEAVTNAVKHADAEVVSIVGMRIDDRVVLVVEDDGAGFDPEATAATTTGHGLVGMRERAEELDGTLSIVSAAGTGTTIRAELPIEEM